MGASDPYLVANVAQGVLPLTAGVVVPLSSYPAVLAHAASALPFTAAVEAMRVLQDGGDTALVATLMTRRAARVLGLVRDRCRRQQEGRARAARRTPSRGDLVRELGWDDQWQAEWDADPVSTSGAQPGRVVRVERTVVGVALDSRTVTVHATGLAVGDWVATDGESWASPLARRTQLSRQSSDRTSAEQVLAANVDVVIIVESVSPEPNPRRVERLLTLAWASGATPLVVLTKEDLALVDHVPEIEAVALGVAVIAVSSHTGEGVEEVRRVIGATPGRTFVLVGPSGAGKSSLVNALAGHQVMATAEVRSDGKGRHTTTHRELLHIDGLGCLVDTPGSGRSA